MYAVTWKPAIHYFDLTQPELLFPLYKLSRYTEGKCPPFPAIFIELEKWPSNFDKIVATKNDKRPLTHAYLITRKITLSVFLMRTI